MSDCVLILGPPQTVLIVQGANQGPQGPGVGGAGGAHNDLTGRDAASAHPIAAIDGLQAALDGKAAAAHNHDGSYEPAGTAAGAVAAHTAAADPHGDRAFAASAIATHAAAAGAHSISGVDGLAAALALLAPLLSPALTGTPTAPTAAPGTNSTQLATTGFVAAAIAALLNSAPGALDTLDELAAALGDDPNFATTVTNALAGKLAKASNLADLTDAAAARTNLGAGVVGAQVFQGATAAAIRTVLELGAAALRSIGTSAGQVRDAADPAYTDARTPTAHTHPLGDLQQSGAESGNVPTWNGTAWVPQAPAGGSGGERRYDESGNVQYAGQAPVGSAEGSAVWTIRRLTYSSGVYQSTATATDVTWTGRAGHTYA